LTLIYTQTDNTHLSDFFHWFSLIDQPFADKCVWARFANVLNAEPVANLLTTHTEICHHHHLIGIALLKLFRGDRSIQTIGLCQQPLRKLAEVGWKRWEYLKTFEYF
jgi:hypothetical protein